MSANPTADARASNLLEERGRWSLEHGPTWCVQLFGFTAGTSAQGISKKDREALEERIAAFGHALVAVLDAAQKEALASRVLAEVRPLLGRADFRITEANARKVFDDALLYRLVRHKRVPGRGGQLFAPGERGASQLASAAEFLLFGSLEASFQKTLDDMSNRWNPSMSEDMAAAQPGPGRDQADIGRRGDAGGVPALELYVGLRDIDQERIRDAADKLLDYAFRDVKAGRFCTYADYTVRPADRDKYIPFLPGLQALAALRAVDLMPAPLRAAVTALKDGKPIDSLAALARDEQVAALRIVLTGYLDEQDVVVDEETLACEVEGLWDQAESRLKPAQRAALGQTGKTYYDRHRRAVQAQREELRAVARESLGPQVGPARGSPRRSGHQAVERAQSFAPLFPLFEAVVLGSARPSADERDVDDDPVLTDAYAQQAFERIEHRVDGGAATAGDAHRTRARVLLAGNLVHLLQLGLHERGTWESISSQICPGERHPGRQAGTVTLLRTAQGAAEAFALCVATLQCYLEDNWASGDAVGMGGAP